MLKKHVHPKTRLKRDASKNVLKKHAFKNVSKTYALKKSMHGGVDNEKENYMIAVCRLVLFTKSESKDHTLGVYVVLSVYFCILLHWDGWEHTSITFFLQQQHSKYEQMNLYSQQFTITANSFRRDSLTDALKENLEFPH